MCDGGVFDLYSFVVFYYSLRPIPKRRRGINTPINRSSRCLDVFMRVNWTTIQYLSCLSHADSLCRPRQASLCICICLVFGPKLRLSP